MRILVTGAAGFMGSHLFDLLADQLHYVVGIDNYSLGTYKHTDIFNLDLRNKEEVDTLIHVFKPEIVYHLAAWAHEGLSQFAPINITENNYNAYLNTLIPAVKYGVKRVVLCSSMSVYGAQVPPFNEEMERKPEDVYAIAKSAMERATEILAEVHGFEYTIIRPHNVYGPRQNISDPYRNVVGIFINRLLNGKPPIIYGDGEQTRAFSYIDDVIPYLASAGFLNTTKGEIINLGPLKEYSINQLANRVLKAFSSDLEPIHYPDRPKEVKHAYCTNDKAIALLGYKDSTDLFRGVTKMVDWAKKLGPQEFKYLNELELQSKDTPKTWSNKEM